MPRHDLRNRVRAALRTPASNYTGKEGIQALALRGMMGVDLTAIPHHRSRYRTGDRLGDRPGLLRLPLRPALLLLACARAGTRISGGKNLPGKSPKAVNPVGQALRMAAMAARRSETFIGAKHRARLARMDTPRCDQGDRPRTRLPDLPHGDRRPEIRRAGHRRLREAAPQQKVRSSRPPSPKTRAPTRPGTAKRRNAKLNAVNCLGICYSRARQFPADRRAN